MIEQKIRIYTYDQNPLSSFEKEAKELNQQGWRIAFQPQVVVYEGFKLIVIYEKSPGYLG